MNRFIKIILCLLCSVILFFGILSITTILRYMQNPNTKEINFINCYNAHIRETIENPETVVITSIEEKTDAHGGTLVCFTYEYITDIGYKTSRKVEIVTKEITIDPSLITLTQGMESYFAEELAKLNGKSAPVGTTTENALINVDKDAQQVIILWELLQADSTLSNSNEYDLEKINRYIKQP